MKILVVGATGATGKRVVHLLLKLDCNVVAIIRPTSLVPEDWNNKARLVITKADVSTLTAEDWSQHLYGCDAIVSCLGHNLTWKGIFGKPRNLVTSVIQHLCNAVIAHQPEHPVKLILMNTAGNTNRDLREQTSFSERIVISIIRTLLPPHKDNEDASDYLRVHVGQNHRYIEWVIVRPDTLIDEDEVTRYSLHPSPTRSAIFNAGITSRINVADCMTKLIHDDTLWEQWKGKMPVIYNDDHPI